MATDFTVAYWHKWILKEHLHIWFLDDYKKITYSIWIVQGRNGITEKPTNSFFFFYFLTIESIDWRLPRSAYSTYTVYAAFNEFHSEKKNGIVLKIIFYLNDFFSLGSPDNTVKRKTKGCPDTGGRRWKCFVAFCRLLERYCIEL